jgi:aspartate racemase
MKKIGLIGGMGWESTALYYRTLNRLVNQARGGQASARLQILSHDFGEAYPMLRDGRHACLAALIADDLRVLAKTGCSIALICCNTAHQALRFIGDDLRQGLLPIMDTVVLEAHRRGYRRVAVLGTSSTLASGLYAAAFESAGIGCVMPDASACARIDRIIFDELMFGTSDEASRQFVLNVIARLRERGAQAAVLGCTELPLLVEPGCSPLPVLDSVELHCREAVSLALEA